MSFVCIAQLNFEDVLAEPDASHGFDPIWRSAFILFTGSRYWIYRLLSALLALPLALVWGIAFSLITFVSVWLATPVLRILDVVLFYIRKVNHPTTTNATPINLQRFYIFPIGRGGSHANGRRARGQRFRRLLPQEGQQLAGSAPVRLKQSRWNTPLAPSTAFTTPNLTHDDMQTTNCSVERYSETPDFCFFDYN